MFEYGTAAQKGRLVNTMEGQVLGLSLQMYGCHVVQKVRAPHISMYCGADGLGWQAIEYVNPDQQAMFVQELSPSVLRCVKDVNGTRVSIHAPESNAPTLITFYRSFRRSSSMWCPSGLDSLIRSAGAFTSFRRIRTGVVSFSGASNTCPRSRLALC